MSESGSGTLQQPRPASERRGGGQAAGPVRRRASLTQGRALESLGHAVEYLVDSRLFLHGTTAGREDQEAIQILMRLSRTVFAECSVVTPVGARVKLWLHTRIGRNGVRRDAL